MVQNRIPRRFGFDATRDIQGAGPDEPGRTGSRTLNVALQAALNPADRVSPRWSGLAGPTGPGDKVMQTANDYDKEVFNGDLGFVSTIDADAQEVTITFDGRDVVYQFGELDEVSLAFSTTIHKSQGSEYPAVVIPVGMTHYMMLRRNLIYTGVTRGKKLVVLVVSGKPSGLLSSAEGGRRWSKLRELLESAGFGNRAAHLT